MEPIASHSSHAPLVDEAPDPGRRLAIGAAFIALYLLVERLTLVHEIAPLGISPWSPTAGMIIVLLMIGGLAYTPFVFAATFLSNLLVYDAPLGTLACGAAALTFTLGFTALAFIMQHVLKLDLTRLDRAGIIVLLTAVPALVGIFAIVECAVAYAAGLSTTGSLVLAIRDFWTGVTAGIVTVAPVAKAVAAREGISWSASRQSLLDIAVYIGGTAIALWAIQGLQKGEGIQYFYLLFPPIVWIAIRRGLPAVAAALLITHTATAVLLMAMNYERHEFVAGQILVLVLSGTGLLLGAAETERHEAEERARIQSAEITRISRHSAAGAMGSALAHEISQPLSTLAAYLHAARRMLQAEPCGDGAVAQTLVRAEAEADRARLILERVRDFVSAGKLELERFDIAILVERVVEAWSQTRPHGLPRIAVTKSAPLPRVMADPVQIEQALLNLITNAGDAVMEHPEQASSVNVDIAGNADRITIVVSDDGPGISPEIRDRLLEPFETTKARGMGLGLSLTRQIIEAHGGTLRWSAREPHGASFTMEIPVDGPTWAAA